MPYTSQLRLPVIIQFISENKQSIALLHTDISESIKRIGLLIEIGTVAKHIHTIFTKTDITSQYLKIGSNQFIKFQFIGGFEKDFIFHCRSREVGLSTLRRFYTESRSRYIDNGKQNQYYPDDAPEKTAARYFFIKPLLHRIYFLIQPSYMKSQSSHPSLIRM